MPRLIISFDMNSGKPKSSAARSAFKEALKARGWTNEIRVGATLETLPDTTLVSARSDIDAKLDVLHADATAKRIEPAFELEKYVISSYQRIVSRSDDTQAATTRDTVLRQYFRDINR